VNHLKEGSIRVKEGDPVKEGDELGRCGNSGRSPYPHLHFQVQGTPYIGSATLEYPVSYHILHRKEGFELRKFKYPGMGEQVSNMERNELMYRAFHFIPGKHYRWEVLRNGEKTETLWEVNTDPYNNSYIKCRESGAMAYYFNDGNMLYFTHYSGNKRSLLYYFFQAAFQVQLGYYQDLSLHDNYPLNLVFRHPLLGLQDLVAPFWKFLRSEYQCHYRWIDNDMAPSEIKLVSSARNILAGRTLQSSGFTLHIDEKGIRHLVVDSPDLQLEALCKE
jgi:hypothetical protein